MRRRCDGRLRNITVPPKVRSAGHWNLVSKDVVAQTLESLTRVGTSARLFKSERVVQQAPDDAIKVSYQVQHDRDVNRLLQALPPTAR